MDDRSMGLLQDCHLGALANLAAGHLRMRNHQEALRFAEAALAFNNHNTTLMCIQAAALAELGLRHQALAVLQHPSLANMHSAARLRASNLSLPSRST